MTRLNVGDVLSTQLDGLHAPVELCDPTQRVLAQFMPAFSITPEQLAADRCPYTVDELLEAHQATGGRSLAEFWQDLRPS